jgi:general secretion pathway protein L
MPSSASYTRVLDPLRLRYLDSPLPGWLRAASEAVLGLMPRALRQQLGAQERRLLLRQSHGVIRLEASVDRQLTSIGSVPADDHELLELLRARLDEQSGAAARWLLLDEQQVLRRILSLPIAAEPRLREVMAFEIDRQTPFAAEQVSFEARVLSRDIAAKTLRAELVVLPTPVLEAALTGLGPLASGLTGVDVVDADGHTLGVNLLPAAKRGQHGDRQQRLRWLFLAIFVVALLLSLFLNMDNRRAALEQLQAQVDANNVQVREVRKLRNELQQSVTAANFLSARRAKQPTMLELLNDLTRRIPDNTSLEKFSVNDGHIILIGQSKQAPALVGLLQASPLIVSPALAGAVQTDPRTGLDRFTLTAVVVGSQQEVAHGVPGNDNP